MSDVFHHKVAVVTGAGRGLGQAIAEGLSERGATVILVARSRSEITSVATTIRSHGGSAEIHSADLGDKKDLDRTLEFLTGSLSVDILINNAATVDPLMPTTELHASALVDALAVNVVAPIALSARLVPAMVARGWGRVVNLSSGVVEHPGAMVGANAYVSTKAALEAHSINFARELDGTGVTVNVYRPGLVDTSMQESIRSRDPRVIGQAMHSEFVRSFASGALISPTLSAARLLELLETNATGQVWSVG